jgi:hypothetical protein
MLPFKAYAVKFLGVGPGNHEFKFMDQYRVQFCIEHLCQKGCTEVLNTIHALEQNQTVDETVDLSSEEVQAVLSELKSIMDIYRD